jgi:hypothetical protein
MRARLALGIGSRLLFYPHHHERQVEMQEETPDSEWSKAKNSESCGRPTVSSEMSKDERLITIAVRT